MRPLLVSRATKKIVARAASDKVRAAHEGTKGARPRQRRLAADRRGVWRPPAGRCRASVRRSEPVGSDCGRRTGSAERSRQQAARQEAAQAPARPQGVCARRMRRRLPLLAAGARRQGRSGAAFAGKRQCRDRRATWPDRRCARRSPAGRTAQEMPVFAALDLGTNNCRLLVAVPTRPGQFRVIDAFSRIVRLGEGLSSSGRLGKPAMDRAVEALKICADKLATRSVLRSRLIATEACRSAENGGEFLDRVKSRDRARSRDHRPRDRGAARRFRLRLAGRSRRRRRRAVRHRRRLVGNRADRRLRPALAAPCQPHRRLDLAAGRRRVAGRAVRRPRGDRRRCSTR